MGAARRGGRRGGVGGAATLYAPLGALRAVFDRPDLVRRALAGEPTESTPADDLRARGWRPGPPWDGGPVVLQDPTPAATAREPAPVPAHLPAARPTDLAAFVPGPALTTLAVLPGRAAILDELLALCAVRAPVALLGPRRAGKTSLLYTLARQLTPTHDVHHVTLEGAPLATRDELARRMVPALAGESSPAEALRRRDDPRPQVFLLDELGWLTRLPADHLAWLRALIQDPARPELRRTLVLAGSHQDWASVCAHARTVPGSSFGNDFSVVEAGPLASADAIQFLTTRAPADAPITADVARWVLDLTGGWPFYLQVLGFALVQETRAGRAAVLRDHVRELRHRRLLIDRSHVFEGRWSELPAIVRAVLLAHLDQLPRFDDLDETTRDALLGAGVATAAGSWLDDPPFFDWLRLHRVRLVRANAR